VIVSVGFGEAKKQTTTTRLAVKVSKIQAFIIRLEWCIAVHLSYIYQCSRTAIHCFHHADFPMRAGYGARSGMHASDSNIGEVSRKTTLCASSSVQCSVSEIIQIRNLITL